MCLSRRMHVCVRLPGFLLATHCNLVSSSNKIHIDVVGYPGGTGKVGVEAHVRPLREDRQRSAPYRLQDPLEGHKGATYEQWGMLTRRSARLSALAVVGECERDARAEAKAPCEGGHGGGRRREDEDGSDPRHSTTEKAARAARARHEADPWRFEDVAGMAQSDRDTGSE